ncbi:MAG: tetratricopeptide repeat protein [Candidatus Poribacteria bacterium]|nr:tetratricopeptide repeat protein [Candidatus Poribacteria bacterium]
MQKIYTTIQITSIFGLIILMGCATHNAARVQDYNHFAIKSAQAGLWNEAIFRWNQILSIDPDNAATYNNLGVGYEAIGKIDEAKSAYQRATELDPDSKYYRINYRRCRLHIRRSGTESNETKPESSEQPIENSPRNTPDVQ